MSVGAVLACRARSERLYCKPLQRVGRRAILDHIIDNIRAMGVVDSIVLAIADGPENECFVAFAEKRGLPYVRGPEEDILARVLTAIERFDIETMLRITTECPFIYAEDAPEIVTAHVADDRDFTTIINLPLGTSYELIHRRVLAAMAATEGSRYRAALSVYVRERKDLLRTEMVLPVASCRRPDVNLAVDHPGQLILCDRAFAAIGERERPISVRRLIDYYDANPQIRALVTSIHEDVWAVKADHTMARVWE
jgi:spore coat polysaccharide biosynthesis protein SpsF (cytidylyltransferase family)